MAQDYDFWLYAASSLGDADGTELVANTGFETNTTGWTAGNTVFGTFTPGSIAQSAAQAYAGTKSLLATWPTAARAWTNTTVTTVVGQQYRLTARVYVPTGSADPRLYAAFVSNGASGRTDVKDTWVDLTLDFRAIDAISYVGVEATSTGVGELCYVDSVSVKLIATTDIGFNTAIGTERAYERATAQFRKDQLDSTATVGDQSLTGWWTRGQLSFHKGAGVKYYEVLGDADDTIESRFHDSMDVTPWTPGEVSLGPDWDSFTATGTERVTSMIADPVGVLARTSSGEVQIYDSAGTVGAALYSDVASIVRVPNSYPLYVDVVDGIIKSDPTWSGTLSDHWTPPVGRTFTNAFYAKERILAVDLEAGDWYQLGLAGGAAVSGDVFWSPPLGTAGQSVWVAEAPSTVFISIGNRVFSTGFDTDGLIPTLSAASVALELPVGEDIAGIYYYLGYLVITTALGVRAALVGNDNTLTVGPRIIEGDFSRARQMAAQGDEVLVAGPADNAAYSGKAATVFGVNLASLVTVVQPSWRTIHTIGSFDEIRTQGVVVDGTRTAYAFGPTRVVVQDAATLAPSGQLVTGFHRLGTLEPKAFSSLRVKTEGMEGDIDVAVNTPNGTTYTVGTVTAGDTEDFNLAEVSGFPSALEYLSITFTLNRGTATGPTLLGYQLKALPVPKRQRMIRVPLSLFDSEENRRGQTMLTDPWERLAALEGLEQLNAVVTFEDKETGESGLAYVESVEVTRTAPSAPKGGFGGFIFLTLRVL